MWGRIAVVLGVCAGLAACGGVRPRSRGRSAPTCTDVAALKARVGGRCTVTGVYAIEHFPTKRGGKQKTPWPVVVLDDGTQVMLESVWDASKRPDAETIARLEGNVVTAIGTVHTSPPSEQPQNLLFYTLAPVETVTPK